MIAMKMRVIAEAWIRVSRSGHWTRLSSAQQETKKPRTPPRWRFSATGASRGARRCSDSLAFCLRSFSAWRWARRLILSAGSASARRRGGRHRPARAPARPAASAPGLPLELVEVGAALGELGLEHRAAISADLGVVLGARLLVELGVGAALLQLGLAALLGLSLCAGLRHGSAR